MTLLRRQLPAWSPLSLRTIAAGLRARSEPDVSRRLERALAAEFGAERVRLVASGTLALSLAIRAAGPGGGRRPRVALPAWGCYDLASAADGADAAVLLYDLDPATLGPEPATLRRTLAAGVDAVVVAHLYGVPVALAELAAAARTAGALLIDDAAQGAGGRAHGKPLGAAGDLGVLSFGRGKGRTGGRGGALLAFGDRGPARLDSLGEPEASPRGALSDAARLAALWLLARPSIYGLPASLPWLRLGETIYHPPPARAPLSRLSAGVVLAGAEAVARENAWRREAGAWWHRALAGIGGVDRVVPPAGSEPGWLRYPVVVAGELVGRFSSPAFRGLGVMPGYPRPLAELPGFRERVDGPGAGAFPGAALLARRLFTLPTHSRVSAHDRDRLLGAIRSAAGR